jgi:peptide chain release factor 2
LEDKIKELKNKVSITRDIFNVPKKEARINELEGKSKVLGFWDNPRRAGGIMQELEELKKQISELEGIEKRIADTGELAKMSENEEDATEIEREIMEMEAAVNALEFRTLFSGEYDRNDAIISIYSGAGGVDAQDWAEMLLRMYLRFAERSEFRAKIADETRGQEAGIKNAVVEISGLWAYGYLKSEAGVHRLVRLSPFNSDNLRQTSFALVEVLPVIENLPEVEISPSDIRVDVFRSSGAGGQSVNTTDSAVRITHVPTGVVVTCQNERSQMQNKEQAMKILTAKLHQKYLEEKEKEKERLRGEQVSAEWGSQIRSYVIHPYKMVKDHRTKFETSNVDDVFAGNLRGFMESYLKHVKK